MDEHGLIGQLTAHRKTLGLTQRQVARRMDRTQSTVSEIETGANNPTLATLGLYVAALGVELTWHPTTTPPGPGRG